MTLVMMLMQNFDLFVRDSAGARAFCSTRFDIVTPLMPICESFMQISSDLRTSHTAFAHTSSSIDVNADAMFCLVDVNLFRR